MNNFLQAYKDAIQEIDSLREIKDALNLIDNIKHNGYRELLEKYNAICICQPDVFNDFVGVLIDCELLIKELTDYCVSNIDLGVCILKKLPKNKITFDIKEAIKEKQNYINGR